MPLEPPLLEEIDRGEPRREGEARERREDEPDVEDQEEIRVVAARAELRAAAEPRHDEQSRPRAESPPDRAGGSARGTPR